MVSKFLSLLFFFFGFSFRSLNIAAVSGACTQTHTHAQHIHIHISESSLRHTHGCLTGEGGFFFLKNDMKHWDSRRYSFIMWYDDKRLTHGWTCSFIPSISYSQLSTLPFLCVRFDAIPLFLFFFFFLLHSVLLAAVLFTINKLSIYFGDVSFWLFHAIVIAIVGHSLLWVGMYAPLYVCVCGLEASVCMPMRSRRFIPGMSDTVCARLCNRICILAWQKIHWAIFANEVFNVICLIRQPDKMMKRSNK